MEKGLDEPLNFAQLLEEVERSKDWSASVL